MRFHILTLFPDIFSSYLTGGLLGRALQKELLHVDLHDIREFAKDKHRTVDDKPFGGGAGMLMIPSPLFDAVESIRCTSKFADSTPVVLLSPQGKRMDQPTAERLVSNDDVVLICGRYEGVDERVKQKLVTEELSIGDYVLNGGELAAMVVMEVVARLIPGVVGSVESTASDSFTSGLLKYPQYTRPAEFRGSSVPEILLSGNHPEIRLWRRRESLRRTFEFRKDLLESAKLDEQDRLFVEHLQKMQNDK